MNNILLVFSYQVKNRPEFDKIIYWYDDNGFDVHVFDFNSRSQFEMEILAQVFEGAAVDDSQKIVVLSNVPEIILAWFRCYNALADDYILFIDPPNDNFLAGMTHENFYRFLTNFLSIEDEYIEGKIYVNIDISNYQFVMPIMLNRNNFRYFNSLENIDLNKTYVKKRVSKSYDFNGQMYDFPYPMMDRLINKVYLKDSTDFSCKLDDASFGYLDKNPYFIIFLLREVFYKYAQSLGMSIKEYSHHLAQGDSRIREIVFLKVIDHLGKTKHFAEKIWFLSFAVVLKSETDQILREFMHLLLTDNEWLDAHYSIFINVLFYITNYGVKVYDDFVIQRIQEFKRLIDYYTNYEEFHRVSPVNAPKNRCLVIQTDHLKVPLHSPTKVTLDFALYLKKALPSYKIIILVEDNMVHHPKETLLMPNYFGTQIASDYRKFQLEYLNGVDIEIIYADLSVTKRERVLGLVKKVAKLNPEAIISFSEVSVDNYFLYQSYPMVYISHGGINYLSRADVYLYPSRDEVLEDNKKYNLLEPEKIYDYKSGLNLPDASKVINRLDIGLAEDDFVLITVGNRLDAEMGDDYIDLIGSFIEKNSGVKWVIVGEARLNYLQEKYRHLLTKQIIQLEFESDLPALYKICDAYINPPRKTGGFSIALAMNMKLPVVILRHSSDGLAYVGEQNCTGDTFEEYLDELNKLYNDKEYRTMKGNLMKAQVNLLSMDKAVAELLQFIEIAKQRYEARRKS